MKCQKCGAENPDNAEFCSLCMESLGAPAGDARRQAAAAGPSYVAPGEWRGDAEVLRPTVSKVVDSKVRRFRQRMVITAVVLALMVAFLVLSFTVWRNPSPGERATVLLEAINDRDTDAFLDQFREEDRTAAVAMYESMVDYLGGSGEFVDVTLDTERPNNYEAYSYLNGGTIDFGGSTHVISRSDNLVIAMENRGGTWYVAPRPTRIMP